MKIRNLLVAVALLVLSGCSADNPAFNWLVNLQQSIPSGNPGDPPITGSFALYISDVTGDPSFLLQNSDSQIDLYAIVLDATNPAAGSLVLIRQMSGDQSGRIIFQAVADNGGGANLTGTYSIDPSSSLATVQFTYLGQTYAFSNNVSSVIQINRTFYVNFLASGGGGIPLNNPPSALIAPQNPVHNGDLVILDGSGSSDPDGNALTYRWALTQTPPGSTAVLSDPSAVFPSFTADRSGVYQVSLVVNDGIVDSAAATQSISTYNTPAQADAGPDQFIVQRGTLVRLDGSASSDADGDLVFYSWTPLFVPMGSTATLSQPNTATPSFVADVNGSYIFQLTATDSFGEGTSDLVEVSFTNLPPVADAGPDQAPRTGSSVSLPGSGTDANGDPLTFRWSLLTAPAGSTAALADADTDVARFTADKAGTYVVQLIVNDGFVDSPADTVAIQAISAKDAATATLVDLINYLSGVPKTDGHGHKVFKQRGMQRALTHQLHVALWLIEHGAVKQPLQLLKQDVPKMDGCASRGNTPDRNDWIRVCSYQNAAHDLLSEAISYLEEVPRNGKVRPDRHNRKGGGR